jgi:hypothetical protein
MYKCLGFYNRGSTTTGRGQQPPPSSESKERDERKMGSLQASKLRGALPPLKARALSTPPPPPRMVPQPSPSYSSLPSLLLLPAPPNLSLPPLPPSNKFQTENKHSPHRGKTSKK